MNIALGAVLIFILLLPPVAFYVTYNSARDSRGGQKFSFLDGLLLSAIFSLLLHSLATLFIHREIRFDILFKLLAGDLKEIHQQVNNEEFKRLLGNFAAYNSILFAIMIGLGLGCKWLSEKHLLHLRFEFLFRLHNRWWYIFNGYVRNEEGRFDSNEFDYVFLDVVANTNKGTVIYTGILIDSVYEGEKLDRIYLRSALRREFKKKYR